MKMETFKRAKEIENDVEVISKLLLAKQRNKWVKFSTPEDKDMYISVKFYDRLMEFVDIYGEEISDEFENL